MSITNDTSQFLVGGLPYAVASGTYGGPCAISYSAAVNDARIAAMTPNVSSNTNQIYFHTIGIGQAYTMTNQHFQVMVGTNLNIQGVYITAT